MKNNILFLLFILICNISSAKEVLHINNSKSKALIEDIQQAESIVIYDGFHSKNNWGSKLRQSNFHIGLDLQTKYVWRGMEMIPDESAPVAFPGINYQWNGLYVYAMGGYALNGKYAEVDMGISYTWNGLTIGVNDYYYPSLGTKIDEYYGGGQHTGHWLEVCITYSPENIPFWITASNFFYGYDKIRTFDEDGNETYETQAYSTYLEIGTYYDFLDNNRISLAVGLTPNKSCYTDYQKNFAFCNIDLKYTYNINFKNGWILPLSADLIYNPVYDKPYFNFTANIAF